MVPEGTLPKLKALVEKVTWGAEASPRKTRVGLLPPAVVMLKVSQEKVPLWRGVKVTLKEVNSSGPRVPLQEHMMKLCHHVWCDPYLSEACQASKHADIRGSATYLNVVCPEHFYSLDCQKGSSGAQGFPRLL